MKLFQSQRKLFTYFIAIFLLMTFNVLAQHQHDERCRTVEVNSKRKGVVIPHGKTSHQFEKWLKSKRGESASRRESEDEAVFTIPVIVHIVNFGEEVGIETNISAAQVYSQLEVMNQDFNRTHADTIKTPDIFKNVVGTAGFYFRPVLYDTLGNLLAEPGINRYFNEDRLWSVQEVEEVLIPATMWNPSKYLNIWVANLASNNIGFAYYPVGANIDGLTPDLEFSTNEIDGAVIDYRHFGSNFTEYGSDFDLASRYNKGRTTTHEVGHWLGIRHTWGDNTFDCSVDDFCDDTPATRATSSGIGGDCANENNSCEEVTNDLPDMLQNFMTYADDACMNLFTLCQVGKMRAVIESAIRRKSIIETAPASPIELTAVYRSSGNDVLLNWTPSTSDNVVTYLLERADSVGGAFKEVALVEGTTYSDITIESTDVQRTYIYRVVAASTTNFSSPSNEAQVNTITSLDNFFEDDDFEVYPNPAFENVQLKIERSFNTQLNVKIFNLNGKLIKAESWESFEREKRINLSGFTKGMYLIQIESKNQSILKKLIKY